jgi:hypothetical protein
MKRIIVMALLGIAPFLAASASAQPETANRAERGDYTDLAQLRSEARHDKRALVESTLRLTDSEAKRFWPIYDTFQRSLDDTNRRRNVALESSMFRENRMSNLAAKRLVGELAVIDDTEAKARRTLRNRLMRALPPVTVARYLQLEDKLQAIRDYDIASAVPLVH